MTLRARLIVLVVVLTAAAMIALAAVTYASQRGALLDQVDAQLETAKDGVAQRLEDENGLSRRPRAFGPGGGLRPPVGGPAGALGPGPGGSADVRPGTYAELRSAAGTQVGDAFSPAPSLDADDLAAPVLPAVLRPGTRFTADAQGDDDLRYRVRTFAVPDDRRGPGDVRGGRGGGTIDATAIGTSLVAIKLY